MSAPGSGNQAGRARGEDRGLGLNWSTWLWTGQQPGTQCSGVSTHPSNVLQNCRNADAVISSSNCNR